MTWDNPTYKEHSKSCSTCIEIAVFPQPSITTAFI